MIHCDSLATLAPVCLLCSERDLVCNTPCMVASLVRRHSSHPRPCHFAHTRDNLCSSLRATEWYECTMHIACFHLVVTPLVSINQPWCVFHHQVCVLSILSTCCGGGGDGCVSSLSSPHGMMRPLLVRSLSNLLSHCGMTSSGYAHLSCLKAAMIC